MKKLFVLATVASLTISVAFGVDRENPFENPQSPALTFTLPEDKTQWQNATIAFLTPVIASPVVKDKLQELLNLTIPVTGNFNPSNVDRRIIITYKMLDNKNEDEQLQLLTQTIARHHHYIKK